MDIWARLIKIVKQNHFVFYKFDYLIDTCTVLCYSILFLKNNVIKMFMICSELTEVILNNREKYNILKVKGDL